MGLAQTVNKIIFFEASEYKPMDLAQEFDNT